MNSYDSYYSVSYARLILNSFFHNKKKVDIGRVWPINEQNS